MTKIAVSYRLENNTVTRLDKLVDYYNENARDLAADSPFQKSKISKTDVLDYLIKKAYEEMEIEEEKKWAERNINKLQ